MDENPYEPPRSPNERWYVRRFRHGGYEWMFWLLLLLIAIATMVTDFLATWKLQR